MDIKKTTIVYQISMNWSLTKSDYGTIYNVLFARRGVSETPSIKSCLIRLCIGTRTKQTFDDINDSILVFWKYDQNLTTLPRFESPLIIPINISMLTLL